MSTKRKFQPYYVAYAKAHNHPPAAQLTKDKKDWPGGCMCGFTLWIGEQKTKFYAAHREAFMDPHAISDHKAWGKWLADAGRNRVQLSKGAT